MEMIPMRRMLLSLAAATLFVLPSCSSDSTLLQTGGTGGSAARADGSVGSGGAAGADARAGSGGSVSTGGAASTGGATAVDASSLGTGGNGGGAGSLDGGSSALDGAGWSRSDAGGKDGIDVVSDSGTSDIPLWSGDGAGVETSAAAETGGADGGGSVAVDGGGAGKTFTDLFPRSADISGWIVDPQSPTKSVVAAIATTEAETEALIDGGSAPFYTAPSTPQMFGMQLYRNMTTADAPPEGAALMLYILKMPSSSQAAGLYSAVMSNQFYSAWNPPGNGDPNSIWQDPSTPIVGGRSRIVNAGDSWWINFYKGVYYVEVRLTPSYGPPPDFELNNMSLKTAAFAFATQVVSRL
jgi:hypothetical protein